MSKSVGCIGRVLSYSLSPAFQQAAFDHYGIDARYELWETEPDGLPALVGSLRSDDCLGANVTVPYKQDIMPLIDELDALAERIGAVNTIINKGGRLSGHNTDAEGFLRGLRQEGGFNPAGQRALLLGAGGVARAAAFALMEAGAETLTVVDTVAGKAEELAAAVSAHVRGHLVVGATRGIDEDRRLVGALATADLVVNCTPLGTKGTPYEGRSPLEGVSAPARAFYYDLVYNPERTAFRQQAEAAGARSLGGLAMLVYQGAASFQLWTGEEPPVNIMFEAARRALGD